MLANQHVYYRLAHLTGTFKIIAIDFFYCIFSEIIRRISNYMCWVLFICKRSTSFIGSKEQTGQDHPTKITSADMELRNYPKPKYLSS